NHVANNPGISVIVCDIERISFGPAPGAFNFGRHFADCIRVSFEQDDARPFACHFERHRTAEALAGTGYDTNLIAQQPHARSNATGATGYPAALVTGATWSSGCNRRRRHLVRR